MFRLLVMWILIATCFSDSIDASAQVDSSQPPVKGPPPPATEAPQKVLPTWTAEGTRLVRASITWETVYPRPVGDAQSAQSWLLVSGKTLNGDQEIAIHLNPAGPIGKVLGDEGKATCLMLLRWPRDEKTSLNDQDILLLAPLEALKQ